MDATTTYIAILERTNQQLSLWYNPYGIMVGILTALVALLAIGVAFAIYRQGRDYKEAFQGFLEEQRKIAANYFKTLDEAKALIDKQLVESQTKLNAITGFKNEARKGIQDKIAELEKIKERLETTPVPNPGFFQVQGGYIDPQPYTFSTVLSKKNNAGTAAWYMPAGTSPYDGKVYVSSMPSMCNCGNINSADSNFCSKCGNKLVE